MKQIVLNIDESRYTLFLQFLKTLQYVQVVNAEKVAPNGKATKPNYDFSDLAGKLEWKGDAVAEQRRLRDEW
jgi:hypothetical protein